MPWTDKQLRLAHGVASGSITHSGMSKAAARRIIAEAHGMPARPPVKPKPKAKRKAKRR